MARPNSRTLVVLALFVVGCDVAPAAVVDAGRDAPTRDAPPPPLLLDSATYDCTAAAPPARRSPVRLHCATDPTCTERLISSHRGAGAPGELAPENTLSAIRAAIAAGADMVEMDVRPTLDGTLVLMHDAEVDRTTLGTGRVDAMTLAEVQALVIDATAYDVGDFSCDRVPTFAEALALADGRITIVVDASKTDRTDLIVLAIQAAGALDRVVFDATDPVRTEAAIALEPAVRVLVRATDEPTLDALLARFAAHPPVYVHIEDADPSVMAPLVAAAGHRVFALGFLADLVAVRDDTAYEPLFAAGIQMIQSNRPALLAASLGRLP